MIRMRATLTIDHDAADYMEAGKVQEAMHKLVDTLRSEHQAVVVTFSTRKSVDKPSMISRRGKAKPAA